MLKHFITFLRFACQFFGFCLSNIRELIRDVEIKYPQKKKVTSTAEFEIVDDEDFEDEPPKKKTNVKTNRS